MLNGYVALDIETTGINPRNDSIIEIGMIKVRDDKVTGTFHTLVRPLVKLPLRIKNITGIDDEMLAGAPGFHQVKDDVEGFIEGEAILGHSVGFDINFLQSSLGRTLYNPAYDTLELARIILPSAKSYRLADLCSSAGFKPAAIHRALEDAGAAIMLYEYLVKRLHKLDGHIIAYLEWLLKKAGTAWAGKMGGLAVTSLAAGFRPGGFKHPPAGERAGPYESSVTWGNADPETVKGILSEGGLLERTMPSFQHRYQQAEMAAGVARALNEKKFLLVEAGTGTGKSMAYLIPAMLWVAAGGPRVVISTRTINLQEQLLQKDIPDLMKCLGINVKVVLAKGRANYICLRRWQAALPEGPGSEQEAVFFARVLVWLNETKSGDRSELNLNIQEEEFWHNICAEADACMGNKCAHNSGACFVAGARREAESSGLIITNHALLFSDIRAGNMVLPSYGPLIIDEAHHLEDAATEQMGRQVSGSDLRRWLSAASRYTARCWELVPLSEESAWMSGLVSLREGLARLRSVSDDFFSLLRSFICSGCAGEGDQLSRRIKSEDFCGEEHGPLWAQYRNFTFEVRSVLDGMRRIMALMQAWAVENDTWGGRLKDLMQLAFTGEELLENVEFNLSCPDHSFVYWISVYGQGEWAAVTLQSSPVRVGALLYDRLFSEKESVVMTSATLTVNGSFDFFTERTGIDRVGGFKVEKIEIESPFFYERQSMLCLVGDLPHQGHGAGRQYLEKIGSAIRDLAAAAGGKTLVLFTSHRVLREVYGLLKDDLEEKGISVLGHGIDGSRTRLVEEFKKSRKALLMGAASFWEGIDIPGEDLTSVFIVKLPFPSPSAPVMEARMEDLEMSGRSSFYEYYLPLAVIRFKQGFGRLIRSETDRGVVVVFDRRIVERGYGRHFLGSLPVRDYFKGSLSKVKEKVAEWFSV